MMAKSNDSRVVFVKLAACGATIAAIAFAIVTLSPTGEVQDTEADVIDFGFKSRTERFTDALDKMGHHEPEAFDLNGNVVYFSSTHAQGSPMEVMERYQREMVNQGYNKEIHGTPTRDRETQMEMTDAMLFGDLVPMQVSDDHIIMASGTIKGEPENMDELVRTIPPTKDGMLDLFTGHKWVEIFRTSEYEDRSMVISTWGDNIDPRKMMPGNRELGADVNTEVPACPGCERTLSFKKLGKGKLHRHNGFRGPASQDATVEFYRQAMANRGWELTETSALLEKVRQKVEYTGDDASFLQFTRNDESLLLMAFPDTEYGTRVQIVETD